MRRWALSLLGMLVLVGCSGSGQGINDTLAIGGVWSLTGAAAGDGTATRNGAQLAVDQVNTSGRLGSGRKFRLVSQDDASTLAGAQNGYNALLAQPSVLAIIGPTDPAAAKSVMPSAQAAQAVAIGCTTGSEGLTLAGSYTYCTALGEQALVARAVNATWQRKGYHKVAILSDAANATTKASAAAFHNAFAGVTASVVANETFQTGDTDFSAQLNRIIAANPEALGIAALSADAVNILTQAQNLGLPSTMTIVGGSGFAAASLTAGAGSAGDGVVTGLSWVSGSGTTGNTAFVSAYRSRFGTAPTVFAAEGYATVYVLADAVSRCGLVTRGLLRDALNHTSDLSTILGKFSFGSDRNAVFTPWAGQLSSGAYKVY